MFIGVSMHEAFYSYWSAIGVNGTKQSSVLEIQFRISVKKQGLQSKYIYILTQSRLN